MFFKISENDLFLSNVFEKVKGILLLTKTSAKVSRREAWTFVCSETSSSLTKGLIIPIIRPQAFGES